MVFICVNPWKREVLMKRIVFLTKGLKEDTKEKRWMSRLFLSPTPSPPYQLLKIRDNSNYISEELFLQWELNFNKLSGNQQPSREERLINKCPHCAKSRKIKAPLSPLLSTPGSRSTGMRLSSGNSELDAAGAARRQSWDVRENWLMQS